MLIFCTIYYFKENSFNKLSNNKIILYLTLFSTPVLLFLINSAKPTLFAVAINFFAFYCTFFILPFEISKKNKLFLFILIEFFLLLSTQIKFSFFLSAILISFFVLNEMRKSKLLISSISILSVLFILIVLPREIYEFVNLNNNIITNFFYPITDPYIYKSVKESLQHGPGLERFLPYWLFFPRNFGNITYTLGLGLFAIFINQNTNSKYLKKIYILIFLYFIIGLIFGQPSGRFFIEPYLWLVLISLKVFNWKKNLISKIFFYLIILK